MSHLLIRAADIELLLVNLDVVDIPAHPGVLHNREERKW
jgi:hypothetical protein